VFILFFSFLFFFFCLIFAKDGIKQWWGYDGVAYEQGVMLCLRWNPVHAR
jgi:hypothetical protein